MEILTREEQINLMNNLSDELWVEWVLLMGDITSFYSELDSMRLTKEGNKSIDDGVSRVLSLLYMNESDISIEFFRDFFKYEVESVGGRFKDLKPFPKYYNSKDNLLSKAEDAELSFYFAVKNCISYKDSKKISNLITAVRLHGYALGLSGIKGLCLPKYHEDIKPHDLGGQVMAKKAELAKNQLLILWNDRFNNSNLIKKGKAEFGRYIYNNPHLIKDEHGNTLKKANGDNWYTDPNTISALLPKK